MTIDGIGHPAQWGDGTWAVPDGGGTVIGVYLYNRVWRFSAASVVVPAATDGDAFEYRAGPVPLGPGSIRARTD